MLDVLLILPSCSASSGNLPSAQAELGGQWKIQDQSQPNPGPRPDGSPCTWQWKKNKSSTRKIPPSFRPPRPTVNVSGTRSGRHCYRIDDSYAKERLHGWFYLVLLPYFVPLAVSLFPVIRLSLKLYRRNRTMLESGEIDLNSLVAWQDFQTLLTELQGVPLARKAWSG